MHQQHVLHFAGSRQWLQFFDIDVSRPGLKDGICILFFCHSHSAICYLLWTELEDKHCWYHYDYDCDRKIRYMPPPWVWSEAYIMNHINQKHLIRWLVCIVPSGPSMMSLIKTCHKITYQEQEPSRLLTGAVGGHHGGDQRHNWWSIL